MDEPVKNVEAQLRALLANWNKDWKDDDAWAFAGACNDLVPVLLDRIEAHRKELKEIIKDWRRQAEVDEANGPSLRHGSGDRFNEGAAFAGREDAEELEFLLQGLEDK